MNGIFDESSAPHPDELAQEITKYTYGFQSNEDLDPIIERVGDARFVLLGEATHGTSEYYSWRARLSQRLILEKGFSFIAVEGDWPDCYRVNRFIKGYDNAGTDAYNVLHGFQRWPTWMWANWEVVAFVRWLKQLNYELPEHLKVGFYGLDVYSLWDSLDAIAQFYDRQGQHDQGREALGRVLECFEPYIEDEQAYARATALVNATCEQEVIEILAKVLQSAQRYENDFEAKFNAEQNAHVLVNAERYYRTMVRGGPHSWNLRDRHMADTLERLLYQHGPEAKAIVWEHNTHIGDARATNMANKGMYNIGQLVRERYGEENAVLIGFGAHRGQVIAGRAWGAQMRAMRVPEAIPGSWEDVFIRAGSYPQVLIMADVMDKELLTHWRGHRAIGVVYQPEYEQFGNYVPTVLPQRYDVFVFLDETHALHPLHLESVMHGVPETYPWGV